MMKHTRELFNGAVTAIYVVVVGGTKLEVKVIQPAPDALQLQP